MLTHPHSWVATYTVLLLDCILTCCCVCVRCAVASLKSMYLEREEIRAACNQPISCVVVDASGHCVEDVPHGYQMEVGRWQGGSARGCLL